MATKGKKKAMAVSRKSVKKPARAKKMRVGFFSFTGCEGCMITFVEMLNNNFKDWIERMDIRYMKLLQSKNDNRDLDIAFVEGAIGTKKQLKVIKEIRKNSKKLVCIGSCAINGSPSNNRNSFDEKTMKEIQFVLDRFKHLDRVYGVSEVVKSDLNIPGCPVSEELFIKAVNELLGGKDA